MIVYIFIATRNPSSCLIMNVGQGKIIKWNKPLLQIFISINFRSSSSKIYYHELYLAVSSNLQIMIMLIKSKLFDLDCYHNFCIMIMLIKSKLFNLDYCHNSWQHINYSWVVWIFGVLTCFSFRISQVKWIQYIKCSFSHINLVPYLMNNILAVKVYIDIPFSWSQLTK